MTLRRLAAVLPLVVLLTGPASPEPLAASAPGFTGATADLASVDAVVPSPFVSATTRTSARPAGPGRSPARLSPQAAAAHALRAFDAAAATARARSARSAAVRAAPPLAAAATGRSAHTTTLPPPHAV